VPGLRPGEPTHPAPKLNGNWKFEVAVSEGQSLATLGSATSYTWTQNIVTTVSEPPVLTLQPDDPMRDFPTKFAYKAGPNENDLVNRYQCRVDGGVWQDCSFDSQVSYDSLENGEHTFEVKAGNQFGYGPAIAPFTWTGTVPNPEPSVRVGEQAVTRLNGTEPFESVGGNTGSGASREGVIELGDVNGDGIDDVAVGNAQFSSNPGVYVVFGSRTGLGEKDLTSLGPKNGFRIESRGSAWDGVRGYRSIGDQNGDGIRDIVVAAGMDSSTYDYEIFVVYGGVDPTDLSPCPDAAAVRCLELNSISDDQGYALTVPSDQQLTSSGELGIADFDGDGIDDIAMGDPFGGANKGTVLIVRGGERTGTSDVTSLAADQAFRINGAMNGSQFGHGLRGIGDVNDDGKDDLFVGVTFVDGGGYIVYGRSFGGVLDASTFSSADGIRFVAAPIGETNAENLGDLNGDGRPELAFASVGDFQERDAISVLYGPEQPTSDPLVGGDDLVPGAGYLVDAGSFPGFLGVNLRNIGDFNNDGTPDLVTTAPKTPVDGVANRGGAYVVFGQHEHPEAPIQLGPGLTPKAGVALLGQDLNNGQHTYQTVSPIGDFDADGLTDFAVGAGLASPNGLTEAGSVYIVPGKSLINQVKTGKAAGVGNESAVLNAGLTTNNRDSQVWFEYGTTDEYGSSTDPESFDASSTGDAASAAIDGLEKNTTYHYRAVAKNALGLVRYGDDKTFTTTNADDKPIETCDLDPTGPGCVDYCKANPTAKGCDQYDWCGNNPGKCTTGTSKARLALISTTKKIAVKRGKKGTLAVAVVNTGGKAATGVKVCVKAPKRLVKVKKCVKVGKLASGKTRVVKIKVKAKRKKGKAVLKLTASGNKLSAKKAKAKVVVR